MCPPLDAGKSSGVSSLGGSASSASSARAVSGIRLVEEFTFDRDKRCGRGSYCRPCEQERSRDYYQRNRERILARMAARRGPAPARFCSECRVELEGRQRVVCSSRCRDARFRRLHPEAYAAKEARKVVRRRERRGEAR
jgi:hypothetical protein